MQQSSKSLSYLGVNCKDALRSRVGWKVVIIMAIDDIFGGFGSNFMCAFADIYFHFPEEARNDTLKNKLVLAQCTTISDPMR